MDSSREDEELNTAKPRQADSSMTIHSTPSSESKHTSRREHRIMCAEVYDCCTLVKKPNLNPHIHVHV